MRTLVQRHYWYGNVGLMLSDVLWYNVFLSSRRGQMLWWYYGYYSGKCLLGEFQEFRCLPYLERGHSSSVDSMCNWHILASVYLCMWCPDMSKHNTHIGVVYMYRSHVNPSCFKQIKTWLSHAWWLYDVCCVCYSYTHKCVIHSGDRPCENCSMGHHCV